MCFFLFQAEDGIRDLVRSRGLGDVYKRQPLKYNFNGKNIVVTKEGLREIDPSGNLIGLRGHLSLIHI